MPLSQKQMEYLALAWQCFETEPKIDYEKFKTIANLASAASARELMRVTKNKLKAEYGALGGNGVGGQQKKTAAAPATPGKKIKTPSASGKKRDRDGEGGEDEGEGEEMMEMSPMVKKARAVKSVKEKGKNKKGGAVVKMEEGEGDGEESDFGEMV